MKSNVPPAAYMRFELTLFCAPKDLPDFLHRMAEDERWRNCYGLPLHGDEGRAEDGDGNVVGTYRWSDPLRHEP